MTASRVYQAAQMIVCQGETPSHTFRVISGMVRSYVIHETGEEATIAYFGPGDFFPVATPFQLSAVALFYYEAATECSLDPLSDTEFHEKLAQNSHEELQRFARRYTGALLHVDALTQPTAARRILFTLRYLAIRFGTAPPQHPHRYTIHLHLTQHDIAKLSSVSRETTSSELVQLRKSGVIAEHNKYYTVDMDRLSARAGEELLPGSEL